MAAKGGGGGGEGELRQAGGGKRSGACRHLTFSGKVPELSETFGGQAPLRHKSVQLVAERAVRIIRPCMGVCEVSSSPAFLITLFSLFLSAAAVLLSQHAAEEKETAGHNRTLPAPCWKTRWKIPGSRSCIQSMQRFLIHIHYLQSSVNAKHVPHLTEIILHM